MIPPTPSPLPPGTAIFSLPSSYGLWGAAPTAIQVWNWTQIGGGLLQILILGTLVVCAVFIVYKFILQFTGRDTQL